MVQALQSGYVPELSDDFLALFPHRFDYIWANHTAPFEKPTWHTESRHPLSDRMLHQGGCLYGVRFGSQTGYVLADIDRGSLYHPARDRGAIARITETLEPLGITDYLLCTSSYSGGLHVYFPLGSSVPSWAISQAVTALLEGAGFQLQQGQLEIFPNPKGYEDEPTLYKAHRLPLQIGSYLLGDDWQPIPNKSGEFTRWWAWCERRNQPDREAIERIAKGYRRKRYRLSGKAAKFLNDLNADIEPGWTGQGQTNAILGRIALRAYCFGHILEGCSPLAGERLIDAIVEVATGLPGYQDWCRHQGEIRERAAEWARCVEASPKYYPYGTQEDGAPGAAAPPSPPTYRDWQRAEARYRIRMALAEMLDSGTLPVTTRARFTALVARGIGGETLYRHRDLWHPQPVENPPRPPHTFSPSPDNLAEGPLSGQEGTSLLDQTGGNSLQGNGYSHLTDETLPITEGNSPQDGILSDLRAVIPASFPLCQVEIEGMWRQALYIQPWQGGHFVQVRLYLPTERVRRAPGDGSY